MTRKQSTKQTLLTGIGVALAVLALVEWQVALFATIGLLPTFVLAFTGAGAHMMLKLQIVMFCNITAILPFAAQFWSRPSEFGSILDQLYPIIMVYMGAAVGYGLIFAGPIVAAMVLQALSQDRVRGLAKKRQALIDRWGGEVVSGGTVSGAEPGGMVTPPSAKLPEK
ncbi:hypothetical protein [Kordiimonas sediminis]|nr:hypothetical protein [Kordiimonas sediminis]